MTVTAVLKLKTEEESRMISVEGIIITDGKLIIDYGDLSKHEKILLSDIEEFVC